MISGNELHIGRSPDNDIIISDRHVSKKHLKLVKHNGSVELIDLGSSGGTFVNGSRVNRAAIEHGDEILLSKHHKLDWNNAILTDWFFRVDGIDSCQSNSVLIGRGPDCDLSISHQSISRHHARLRKTGNDLVLEDLRSRGGTWVNGRRINQTVVIPGDEVNFSRKVTLDWNHPAVRNWIGSMGGSLAPVRRRSQKLPWIIAGTCLAAGAIAFTLITLLSGGYSSSGTARPGETLRIGTDGILATIPGDAVSSPVEISVERTDPVSGMEEGAGLETPVFTFNDPVPSFNSAITLDIDRPEDPVPSDLMSFPAYWDGERWVQLFGHRQGETITVLTDHLSSWSIISVQQLMNPLTTLLPAVTETVFGIEELSWEILQQDYDQIMSNPEFYFDGEPQPVGDITAGAAVASIRIDGEDYSVVSTNLPVRHGGGYSGIQGQPGVRDDQGNWVTEPAVLFEVLYAYNCMEYFENANTQMLAQIFQDAADDLQSMYFWHGAASAADLLQLALSEYLSHSLTGTPITIDELLSEDVINALEGMVCRGEMVRLGLQLEEIAGTLSNFNEGSVTYDDATSLCLKMEDALNRIGPLADFSRSTFPAYEENWFEYTADRVLGDFGISLPETGEAQNESPANSEAGEMADLVFEILDEYADSPEFTALQNVIGHILNIQGDDPMWEYYDATRTFQPTFVQTFGILRDVAYTNLISAQRDTAIVISSVPSGATVYLDGWNTGMTTPARIEEFEPGIHYIRLYKEGYNEYNATLNLSQASYRTLHAVLEEPTPPLPVFDLDLANGTTFYDNVINVAGRIQLEDASGNITSFNGSAAILTLNGRDQQIPVSNGNFNVELSIPSGASTISLRANSRNGDTGTSRTLTVYGDFSVTDLEVRLTWNTPTSDIDLHVWNPRGEHSYYSHKEISDGFLDIDDTEGYGPETFTSEDAYEGTYTIKINSYDLDSDSYADASVEIYVNGDLYGSYGPHRFTTADYNGNNTAAWWEVARVEF